MRLLNISLLVLVLLAFTVPLWAIGIAGSAGGKRVTVSVDGTWQGTYAAGTTYVLGDIVTDGTTNYRSLQNSNTGHTPASSPVYWQAILAKGDTGPTGATGSQGPTGTAGADGKTVLTTSGAPASGTGVNGDYAYDPATYTMYGPKAAGAWPAGTVIKGADGAGFTGGSDGTYGWLTDSNTSSYTECASGKYGLNFVGGVLYQCSNGTNSVFTSGDSLPTQTGNSGKYLTTNGTAASWGSIAAGSGIAISADIPTETGAANLNDSTHVLTVASTTGYTQFTGTHTPWDTTPAAFAFTDLTDVELSTTQTATPVQITGINYPTAVTATGGTAAICTGATVGTCGTFSASPGNIALNQYVSAQHTSSASNSTAVDTVVTIGGVSDGFRSTTVAASAPTFSSFTINSAGTGLTAALSASTTVGAGGSGGLALSCSTAGAVAATYSSGSPGTSYTYTISPTVYSGDACTAAYTQPGNGLESTTGGSDVAGFSGAGVTNNSMQGGSASITDHFDTDTRANFTKIGGPDFVYNSSSHVITSDGSGGGVSMRYHNTSLGSPDQTLEALIEVASDGNSAAIMRCSGAGATSTGYRVGIGNNITNKLAIVPVSGTSSASPIFFTTPGGASSFDTNGMYRVKFVVSGNTWHAYIDLNNNGSFNDANEDFGTITDSTYTTGNYVGVYFPATFSNIKFDDLIATGN